MADKIVEDVIQLFQQRSATGIKKYGTTLEQNNTDDFIQHLQEELMDAILYLQKIKDSRNSEIPNLSDEKIIGLPLISLTASTLSEKYQEYKDWLNEIPELSDEEINKQAEPIEEGIYRMFFKTGAKWYREQLKSKK
jgi:hypothetical protein